MLMTNPGDLLTVASLVAGFGGTILVFRLQRELGPDVPRESRTNAPSPWIPMADWMLFACVVLLLVFTVLPILVEPKWLNNRVPQAACSAAIVLFTFYIPSIVVHYRRYFWRKGNCTDYTTVKPDHAERIVIGVACGFAAVVFVMDW